jgi:hypothetical protein
MPTLPQPEMMRAGQEQHRTLATEETRRAIAEDYRTIGTMKGLSPG